MEKEKKQIKIRLKVAIIIAIVVALIAGTVAYSIINKDKKANVVEENNKENVKQELNTKVEQTEEQEEQLETEGIEIGQTYEWKTDAKYSDDGNLIEGGSGSSIIFKDNNIVESSSWVTPGGATDYKGTYKIDENKITVTLTEFLEGEEWEEYPEGNNIFNYTIIDSTQIMDLGKRIYKIARRNNDKSNEEEIIHLLKNLSNDKYSYLKLNSIKKDSDLYLVKADLYKPVIISENQYQEMKNTGKIILNNDTYYFKKDSETIIDNNNCIYDIVKYENGYVFVVSVGPTRSIDSVENTYDLYISGDTLVYDSFTDEEQMLKYCFKKIENYINDKQDIYIRYSSDDMINIYISSK